MDCLTCEGNRQLDCPDCNGDGVTQDERKCGKCEGYGSVICHRCGGSGLLELECG